nr:hypothetical protein [Tanacetum cinerariifolium]
MARLACLDELVVAGKSALLKDQMLMYFGRSVVEDVKLAKELRKKLRELGAIILGKSSLSELAHFKSSLAPNGWNARTKQAVNPYVATMDPCASSTGSAISVATNMVTVSLGTETDGSILCPPSANSVVGIKSTVGLTSHAGVVSVSPRQDTVRLICKTVTDVVYVLDPIVGFDTNDAVATRDASKYIPRDGYLKHLTPGGLEGKRLGVLRAYPYFGFANDTKTLTKFEKHCKSIATLIENLDIIDFDDIILMFNSEFVAILAEFKIALNDYLKDLLASPMRTLADVIAFNDKFAGLESIEKYPQDLFMAAEKTNGIGKLEEEALMNLTKAAEYGFEQLMKENKLDALMTPYLDSSMVLAIGGYPRICVSAGYDENEGPYDYLIWQVIQNGNVPVSVTTYTNGMIKVLPPKTAEEVVARERERKARTTLLMALLEDHLAKFHKMADAKEMFQTLLSQLEIHGAGVSHEDANQKFLRSLPSSWSQVALIMRIKPGLDTLRFDDLYNNLKVFERDVKDTTASSSSNIQNVAFMSADNTSSTNDVSTAYSISSPSVLKSQKKRSASYTDEVIHSFFANQSSAPQLGCDDLEQINDDDLEKMDLKWQVAMISMRIKKFHKRTGRKLQFDTRDTIGFDKTKVECFNCHKMMHFARDCRAKGNQDSRRRDGGYNGNKARDNGRRPEYQDDSKALVTIDGEAIDWSGHVEEDTQNFAMMAYSSSNSGSDNESVFMNTECDLENTPVNDRYAEGMHRVPPPMTGNYMPSGPDVEINYSKFTYDPKQTSVDESNAKTSENATCESDSSVETTTSMPAPVDNAPKIIEADDQAIETILLGLPEYICAAVDSCETAQEIWLRVQQMMKGSDIGIQEKKAKLFNEWERFTSNEGESIESYYHSFLKLMNDLKRNKHFPEKIASNLKFLNNLQPEWSRHVTIVHQTKDLHTADYTQLYDFLKYNQKEMVGGNGGNQFRQYAGQNTGNPAGYNDVIGSQGNATGQNGNQIRCYNYRGVGHYAMNCTVRPRRKDDAYLQTQLLIAHKEEAGIQLQAEEYDLMAAAADLDEIEKVNTNCILMANLQQASTSGTQIDSALVYDIDGSAEVHENCDDNEIFNTFTQEEQYTELLKPIPESHQVPHNDNDVISEDTSVEQGGETVEQHPANFEETRALYESLYQNLAIEVEKVNSVNRK